MSSELVNSSSPSTVPATQPITSSPLAPSDAPTKPSPKSSTPSVQSTPQSAASPPIDPSQLNHTPAPIPIPDASAVDTEAGVTSPPLRAPVDPLDSAYLDNNPGGEPSSHPTVAETGSLARSPSNEDGGPGPKSGQLARKERKQGEGIIKLGSFGGEGLVAKPPMGLRRGSDDAVE